MKNKILKILLALAIATNIGGYAHYEKSIEHKMNEISKLQNNVKTKSTKIAKLDDVIKLKDEKLLEQQKVIDNKKSIIDKQKLEIDSQRKEIENFNEKKEGSDGILTLTMNASGYIAMCKEGCSGKTRSGYDVRNTIYYNGMRIIASDLSVLPMYSIVEIEGFSDRFIVLDTGGAIKGNKIDILFKSTNEAMEFGRKNIKVKVIRNGQ